jgi:type II secretory pathway pseudopilin PulG
MIHRLIRDESGMTMALTVIMIVLIGVMGAGLLVFVRNDLEAVVEVNRGQQALEMADAGIEAARKHLSTVDARPENFDDDPDTNSDDTTDNSEWSDDGSPKQLDFDGDGNSEISVAIQYLIPSTTPDEASQPNNAPEVLPPDDGDPATVRAYPNNRNYFRVTVQGRSGSVLRQLQAIYRTENFDLPVAFYATRNISLGGSTTINGISLFANCYLIGLRAEHLSGNDQAYGDWVTIPATGNPNGYNSVARDGEAAGAAALGGPDALEGNPDCPTPPSGAAASGIDYDPTGTSAGETRQKARTATPQRYGVLDFDRDSEPTRDFERNTWRTPENPTNDQPSDTITFPFKTGDATADADLISALKQKARDQGNYIRTPSGSTFDINEGTGPDDYPNPSTLETVYFVEFAEGTDDSPIYGSKGLARYLANTSDADRKVKGTLVVVNGDLEFTVNSADDFQGVVIVRDSVSPGSATTESQVTKFTKGGNIQLEGFASVEGDMSLSGTVDGILPGPLVNGIPGLFKVSLWSWRECYNTACN